MNSRFPVARARTYVRGVKNKTEEAYGQHLELLKRTGDVTNYWFESYKFRLADKTFYTPDYVVQLPSGELECHEVKGYWEDDARVKIKVAASLYPFRFVAIQKDKLLGWKREEF